MTSTRWRLATCDAVNTPMSACAATGESLLDADDPAGRIHTGPDDCRTELAGATPAAVWCAAPSWNEHARR
jgi:hypothetical protein